MAGDILDKLRSAAFRLSPPDRAQLAHELVQSLDAPFDDDAPGAWDTEILRRLAEIDDGTAKLVDRDELRRRMRERLATR